MTYLEAIKDWSLDCSVSAIEDNGKVKWVWDVNAGYQSWGGSTYYPTPQEAADEMEEFLKTFEGPTK